MPAYLLLVPLELGPEDAPCSARWGWRCRCSRRSSTPRSARACPSTRGSRRGRTPTHALTRLWEVERFDRIVVPRRRRLGFTPKDLAWILTHAPSETLILRPAPDDAERAD